MIVVTAVLLAGCATGNKMTKTESGRPEATITGASQEAVQAEIFSLCNRKAAAIRSSTINEVVCTKTMEGGDAMIAQLLIGNSYSSTPTVSARFTIWKAGNDVRVSAYQWIETQMAFGQMRTQELNSAEAFNNLQRELDAISQRLTLEPPSTADKSTYAAPASGALSKDDWKKQQIAKCDSEAQSYQEYMDCYRKADSQ